MAGKTWGPERKHWSGKRWTEERRVQARELYEAGASLAEVAAALGSNDNRVAEAIRLAGGKLRRRGARQHKNCFWRGGQTVDVDGYVLLKVNDHPHANASGYVREHRLVMEQILGRYLEPEEVVHHRNGVRADNRPENLELFVSNGSHLAHELQGRCPKWSEEGRAQIQATNRARSQAARPKSREEMNARARKLYAIRQAAKRAQQASSTPAHSKYDEQE